MANAGIGVTIGSHTLRAVAVRKKGGAWAVTKAVAVAQQQWKVKKGEAAAAAPEAPKDGDGKK